jgi:hypothetical protein
VRPEHGGSWILESLLGVATREVNSTWQQGKDEWVALLRGLGVWPAEEGERRRLARAFLGRVPKDPHGGEWMLDEFGQILHSVEGPGSATILEHPGVDGSAIGEVVRSLVGLSVRLSIETHGEHRGLHSLVEWERAGE